jgi:cell fate (sporulation/competence/biofilm development) regulator YlbF (YheA/YmcA/DUF963 family)
MERQAIIDKAWEVVDEIRQSDSYQMYESSLKRMNTDPALKILADEFSQAKEKYETTKCYGKQHPDFARALQRLAEAKEALFARPEYQDYRKYQKELNEQLVKLDKGIRSILDECSVAKKPKCQGR